MTIGMVGSRRRNTPQDFRLARLTFARFYTDGDTLVSGGCPTGGDSFLEQIAIGLHINCVVLREGEQPWEGRMNIHPALWSVYGKRAGFVRNTFIARDADVLIAVVAPDRTGGTEDTIEKYLGLGKTRLVVV